MKAASHLLCHEAMSTSDVASPAPLSSLPELGRTELPRGPLPVRERLVEEFYNGTAERDWAMWAQEAISILERA